MTQTLSEYLTFTQNPRDLVEEFHDTFGHPVSDDPPSLEDADLVNLRVRLIAEEFAELVGAVYGETAGRKVAEAITETIATFGGHPANGDTVETADALGDLVYVIYGMALALGFPLPEVLEEIHRANMSKLDPATGRPILREDGKVMKGAAYTPPNIAAVLNAYIRRVELAKEVLAQFAAGQEAATVDVTAS